MREIVHRRHSGSFGMHAAIVFIARIARAFHAFSTVRSTRRSRTAPCMRDHMRPSIAKNAYRIDCETAAGVSTMPVTSLRSSLMRSADSAPG
jgi:hypothetical protein